MPTHAEKRVLPHTREQMFDLVIDIEKYPEFLPWCVATRIRQRDDEMVLADMVIGFKVFRERFSTRVQWGRPGRIDVTYSEGPFKYLNNHWLFEPHGDGQCLIDFFVDFEFRSRLMQKAIGAVFNEAVQRMISSFEKRAVVLYGGDKSSPASRFTIASAASTDWARTESRSPSNWWCSDRVLAPFRAQAKCTSPTGFSAVPPVGPATPVTATPRSAGEFAIAPSAITRTTGSLTAP